MRIICLLLAAAMLVSAFTLPAAAFDENALYGDANGDGKVNAKDVTRMMKAIVAGKTETLNAVNSDVNVDGKINARDVLNLMKGLVGVRKIRLGHNDDYSVLEFSTCTKEGVALLKCKECGNEATIPLPLEPHNYVSEVTTEPTCGEPGVITMTCSVCGDTKTEQIEPTGMHVYDITVVSEPTCSRRGLIRGTCAVCGLVETEKIAAPGHDYDANGRCSVCGKEEGWWYISQYIDENGELTNDPYILTLGVGAYETSVTAADEIVAEMVIDFDKYGGKEAAFYLYENGTKPFVNDTSGKISFYIGVEKSLGTIYEWEGTMKKGSSRIDTDIPGDFLVSLFKSDHTLLIRMYDVERPDEEYAFCVFESDLEDALKALS